MAKQQQIPKTILNLFFNGGTRVVVGTMHLQGDLEAMIYNAITSRVLLKIDATIEDEKIESDTVFLDFNEIIFHSIRVPRIISGIITEVPPGLSLDKSVQ